MKSVWFITGANKGLGAAIAQKALAAGNAVVATARDAHSAQKALGNHPDLLVCPLDVTDPAQIAAAVAAAKERFGHVDVLVNNAGYGLLGYFEELSEAQIRRQMETNVFGPMNLTRALLPLMRAQGTQNGQNGQEGAGREGGGGRPTRWIVSVSSTSGVKSVEGGSVYSASKFALEGWMEGLRMDVEPFGIGCLIMEPGGFRTDFSNAKASMTFGDNPLPAYEDRRAGLQERFASHDARQPGDPQRFAATILSTLQHPNPPLRLLCGKYAVSAIGEHLRKRLADMDAWREVSESTDFPG